jgi:RimJ/RimL family protein N-acetyltransferase
VNLPARQDVQVRLRAVAPEDLPVFFEHQRDPLANRMADFPARDWPGFQQHWIRIMAEEANILRTIEAWGQVAGNVVSYVQGDRRFVGYWLGRDFWGRGIATRALETLLGAIAERPLYAYVASHNQGSIRVLEKCGFRVDAPGTPHPLVPRTRSSSGGSEADDRPPISDREFLYRLD